MTEGVGGVEPEYPSMELRNGMKELAGRGDANISASMILRLTETTFTSPTSSRCRSATKDHRSEICLERFRKRFSLERATALSQSSYIMVGEDWRQPSSLQSFRRYTAS